MHTKKTTLCTKKSSALYEKTGGQVPNCPLECAKKTAVCTKDKPICTQNFTYDPPGRNRIKPVCSGKKHPFYQKPKCVLYMCGTCGLLCNQKTTWLQSLVLNSR